MNIKYLDNNAKGILGEIIFASMNKNIRRTKLCSNLWLHNFKYSMRAQYKLLLLENWGTFDAFELVVINNEVSKIRFYEIKTTVHKHKKPNITKKSLDFYKNCKAKGFEVFSVFIYLESDWNVDVVVNPFNEHYYRIHDGGNAYWKLRR